MLEETAHKRVAYDVYQAACPGSWMRALPVDVMLGIGTLREYSDWGHETQEAGQWSDTHELAR